MNPQCSADFLAKSLIPLRLTPDSAQVGLVLNVLQGYPIGTWGFQSAATVHHMAEALRRAFVDRNLLLGDPDFVANPVERLVSPAYAEVVRSTILPDRATPSSTLGWASVSPEPPQTTHYSVIDAAGNAVAVTTTLNGAFGARVVAGRTGILLNNEMDDFTARPGAPNLYGLVQGRANAIAPGKRPLSSMTPTVVSKDGRAVLVIGSPGGPRIITTVLQVILNLVDHGMPIDAAIAAPRVHHQWLPDLLFVEPGALSPDVRAALAAMGHRIEESRPWGEAAGILVGGPAMGVPSANPDMRYFGAADPRSPLATAAGFLRRVRTGVQKYLAAVVRSEPVGTRLATTTLVRPKGAAGARIEGWPSA